MVLPGGRSRGCYLCRQRKIKCDETRPACHQCSDYGRKCPGYADTYTFTFRVQKPQPRKTKTTTTKPATVDAVVPLAKTAKSPIPPRHSNLSTRQISPSWQDQALCFFVNQYRISAGSDGAAGFLDFLPGLMRSPKEDDSLNFALGAVSNLVLYNRIGVKSLYVDARKSYGAALASINTALGSSQEASSDRIFAAVLLLSLFIDVAGERDGVINQHTSGIYHLMTLRGRRNLSDTCSSSLFSWAICHAMTHFLMTGDYQCAGLADLLVIADDSTHWHRAVRVSGKISIFMTMTNQPLEAAGISQSQATNSSAPGISAMGNFQIQLIFQFAADIINEIGQWYRTLPSSWKYPTSERPPSGCNIDEDIFEIHPRGLWAPGYVAIFYCAEIYFYMRLISCLGLIAHSPMLWATGHNSARHELIQKMDFFPKRIGYLLSRLCVLIELILGDIRNAGNDNPDVLVSGQAGGAYMLLGPLWLMSHCPFATEEQVNICHKALGHIGDKLGFGTAKNLIEPASQPSDC
ncbi:hypothetical protein BGW36DRAFT_76089 [Talaromyces proteolyticus]|uniref:Zn(2)-C6 fungal-type domain-containing protein n=1 Tax=Talaromyces proteolyticus TaxID=1131652 RepID=A0AAD4KI57_9EURO|nr:uncharacterized protein BGW36DRAFT_76089 [Talaromyces proteolyticus]KAH8689003.1 hypothetical protein BGW36DRAFT_76089 [Talaromyces proteolyticus]